MAKMPITLLSTAFRMIGIAIVTLSKCCAMNTGIEGKCLKTSHSILTEWFHSFWRYDKAGGLYFVYLLSRHSFWFCFSQSISIWQMGGGLKQPKMWSFPQKHRAKWSPKSLFCSNIFYHFTTLRSFIIKTAIANSHFPLN